MRFPFRHPVRAIAAHPQRLVIVVCAWHLLFWVAAPLLGYRMLPLDTLELLGWGQEWQLGYYKHPPLGAWLGEGFLWLCGGWLGSLYLLAQLCMVVTFLYVFATARLFLDPLRAALAVALLEGSYFHTYLTPNFNMNSLQLPLWAGMSYHFLRALGGGAGRHWLAFGVFAALALMAKYSGLLLLASCLLLVLVDPRGRRELRTPGFWLGAALCLLLIAPHLAWLAGHWQLPWDYLRSFDSAGGGVSGHLLEPLRFAAGAVVGLLFTGLLWVVLRAGRGGGSSAAHSLVLTVLVIGPLLLSVAYGLASGSRLKSTWAFPFFSLVGVVAMMRISEARARQRLPHFLLALVGVAVLSCSMHLLYKTRWGDSKTRFNGAALAYAAEAHWAQHTDAPLRVVIADHIDSAIVSSYARSRPSMLVAGDYRLSPWLSPEIVSAHGALYVCREGSVCPVAWEPALRTLAMQEIDGERFRFGWLPPSTASH